MRTAAATPETAGNAREYALLAVLAIVWGASYAFIRLGVATIPPVTLIAARTLIVGVEALSGIGEALIADLALVAATLCFAGAAIFGRGFGTLDPLVPATGSMLCGSVVLVPISLVAEAPWTIAPSATSVMALVALSVFSTAFAFALYFRL